MTRELHVYDRASAMIALLFVSPNGTVEAFGVEGFNRIGELPAWRRPLRLRALMWRCRAWIPDFRVIFRFTPGLPGFLHLASPASGPVRRRCITRKNKTPQIAGSFGSAHQIAGDGGDRGHPSAPSDW